MTERRAVTVARESFLAAMRPLRRFVKRKDPGEAIISMEGEDLFISAMGVSTAMPAVGEWAGEVRIPARFVLALAVVPPSGDPLTIEVAEGRLRIGSLSISCTLSDSWMSEIPLPLDATPAQILSLRFQYSPERIEKAGLAKRLAAEDAAAMKRIMKAWKELEPLGVKVEDLKTLVKETLKQGIEK